MKFHREDKEEVEAKEVAKEEHKKEDRAQAGVKWQDKILHAIIARKKDILNEIAPFGPEITTQITGSIKTQKNSMLSLISHSHSH